MKRLIAIAITIAVFAAMVLPTSTVLASWETFYASFEVNEDIQGAQGAVWGSYNTDWNYLSTSMRVEPIYVWYKVEAWLLIDVNGDGDQQIGEPYVYACSWERPPSEFLDPLVLTYTGTIPSGAIVHYVVHTSSFYWDVLLPSWGAAWQLP